MRLIIFSPKCTFSNVCRTMIDTLILPNEFYSHMAQTSPHMAMKAISIWRTKKATETWPIELFFSGETHGFTKPKLLMNVVNEMKKRRSISPQTIPNYINMLKKFVKHCFNNENVKFYLNSIMLAIDDVRTAYNKPVINNAREKRQEMFKKVPNHSLVALRKSQILEMLNEKIKNEQYTYLEDKTLNFFLLQLRLNIRQGPILSLTWSAVDQMIEQRKAKTQTDENSSSNNENCPSGSTDPNEIELTNRHKTGNMGPVASEDYIQKKLINSISSMFSGTLLTNAKLQRRRKIQVCSANSLEMTRRRLSSIPITLETHCRANSTIIFSKRFSDRQLIARKPRCRILWTPTHVRSCERRCSTSWRQTWTEAHVTHMNLVPWVCRTPLLRGCQLSRWIAPLDNSVGTAGKNEERWFRTSQSAELQGSKHTSFRAYAKETAYSNR